MSRDTTVIPFRQPEAIDDPLSEVAREGARRMLAQVLIAEADAFVDPLWADYNPELRTIRSGDVPMAPGTPSSRNGRPPSSPGT
jgi:putative transposase